MAYGTVFYYENYIMKNSFNDKTNLYVYKFDCEVSTIRNEFTKFSNKNSLLFTKRQCFVVRKGC